MTLSDTSSVSFSDLMSIEAPYLGLNTGSAEWEVKTAGTDIRTAFSFVSNLQCVGFSDVSGKPITILDSDRRHADLTYFTFRSVVPTATVDIRAPASYLSLAFSLYLPQSLSTSASISAVVIKLPASPALVTTPPKPITDLSFNLGNISDDILSAMDEDQMWTLLIDNHDTLSFVTPTPSVFVQPPNLFTSPFPLSSLAPTSPTLCTSPLHVSPSVPKLSLTPNMDHVCSIDPSSGIMTFTRPLNALYIQYIFYYTFGLDLIMIQIYKHSKR